VPEYSRNTFIIMSMSVAFTSGSSVAVDAPVELPVAGEGTDLAL
jgi:hypothetical protein